MKKITIDTALKIFKSLSQDIRNYDSVFLVEADTNTIIYTDGFLLARLKLQHTYTRGVYRLNGMLSSVTYPNHKAVIPSDSEISAAVDVSHLLHLSRLIKPAGKQAVGISLSGKIGVTDEKYSCNLNHIKVAIDLGCSQMLMTINGMFIFSGEQTELFSSGITNS